MTPLAMSTESPLPGTQLQLQRPGVLQSPVLPSHTALCACAEELTANAQAIDQSHRHELLGFFIGTSPEPQKRANQRFGSSSI
jgi:hypothetical protein